MICTASQHASLVNGAKNFPFKVETEQGLKQTASPFQSELAGVVPCPYQVRPPAKGRPESVHPQRHLFGLLEKTGTTLKFKPGISF